MPNERQLVTLTRDIVSHELRAGHSGTIVRRLPEPDRYEVEFLGSDGCSVVRLALAASDLRPA